MSAARPEEVQGFLAFPAACDLSLAAGAASSFLKSPIVPLSGQIEKAGHFLHPTAIAIGHSVMVCLLVGGRPMLHGLVGFAVPRAGRSQGLQSSLPPAPAQELRSAASLVLIDTMTPDPGPDRLPPIAPEAWTEAQRREAQAMIAGPRGAVLAPFIPLMRSPELMGHVQRLGEHLRYRSAIGVRLTELAILVTAHEWQQAVEWAIHAPIAEREGVAPEIIASIARGERPAALADDEAAVYDVCIELHRQRSVSDATWATAVARLGEPGVVDLIGINGYYALLAMVMNAARTPAR